MVLTKRIVFATPIARAVLAAVATLCATCLVEPEYRCESSEQCLLNGFEAECNGPCPGICDAQTSRCAYVSEQCRGVVRTSTGMPQAEGWVNAQGDCVRAPVRLQDERDEAEASPS